MNLKKIIISLLIIIPIFLCGETTEINTENAISLTEYKSSLDDYELLLNKYEDTIQKYNKLLKEYNTLSTKYKTLSVNNDKVIKDYETLNNLYLSEIDFHKMTLNSLSTARNVINNQKEDLDYLLSITDTNYITIVPQVGYLGTGISVGIGALIRIPKLPISFMLDADYIPTDITAPINIQLGFGISL